MVALRAVVRRLTRPSEGFFRARLSSIATYLRLCLCLGEPHLNQSLPPSDLLQHRSEPLWSRRHDTTVFDRPLTFA